MATAIENGMALWMWPLTMAKLSSDWMETMTCAAEVVDTRMPMIAAAWLTPTYGQPHRTFPNGQ